MPRSRNRSFLYAFVFSLAFAGTAATAAETATPATGDADVDRTIEMARQRALNADRPDWPAVQARAAELVRAQPGEAGRTAAIRHVLASLRDGHSFYMSAEQLSARQSGAAAAGRGGAAGKGGPRPPIAAAQPAVAGFPRLSVNAWVGDSDAAMTDAALQVRRELSAALGGGACGLVVDLSANGGGNMWPMMGGLAPLYDEGLIEAYDNGRGRRTELIVKRGALYSGDTRLPDIDLPPLPARPRYVAVILGARTASSGEITALGFKGQGNVRSFGAPTAGATSSNQSIRLPSGGLLALTTSRLVDRNGGVQHGPLQPDERSEQPLDTAAQWLTRQCGAGPAPQGGQ
ncbi:S41 family peptidase [Lysobacter enzymogenes]|uniref:S41 family peptidase n=1 Tax=Lysobacter enzymogenes TaxID=69 RepID=UPI001A978E4D|nr:S41 family peptidase [Lysobacter enzymogenes]QQP97908.1 S41 family peptidase [Lysobacter enzymogenes]